MSFLPGHGLNKQGVKTKEPLLVHSYILLWPEPPKLCFLAGGQSEEFETSHVHMESVSPNLNFFFFTLKCRNAKIVGKAFVGNSDSQEKKREPVIAGFH